jgi:3-dehydroquinate synthase
MQTVILNFPGGDSRIVIGESLSRLPMYIRGRRAAIVTDVNVKAIYGSAFPDLPLIEVGQGEGIKNMATVETVYRRLTDLELDRSSLLVGLGGGIVGDITGFAAATFMRGLSFITVPTTLLAQADAGVGGKTGVNFDGYKNLIGCYHQPECVISDPAVLATLPADELACGLAEIIKHGAIADAGLFDAIDGAGDRLLAADPRLLEQLVFRSVQIKAAVVTRDEREMGERRKLNFGHTIGHAVERVCGCKHGQAVAIGMTAAASISCLRGLLPQSDVERLRQMLINCVLPTDLPPERDRIAEALGKDKKRQDEMIPMVLLSAIGKAEIVPVKLKELRRMLYDLP